MGKATVQFTPRGDGDFEYELKHTDKKVQKKIDLKKEIFYAHGDTIVFENNDGNFSVQWDHFAGSIKLKSPFKDERPGLPKTNLPNKPFKSSDKVDTKLSKATRKALREAQGFVARYEYRITVDTPNGTFTDTRIGTYDC